MAQHRSVPCPATGIALQTGAIFAALAVGAADAHRRGIAAVDARREERNSHILAGQVGEASASAHEWAALARKQAIEIEQLRAENARLNKVAKQHFETAQRLAKKAA